MKYITLCKTCFSDLRRQGKVKAMEREGMAIVVKCGVCSNCRRKSIVDIYEVVDRDV